jgi:hypothetical protein
LPNFAAEMNFPKIFTVLFCIVFTTTMNAQYTTISGVVYDISGRHPVEAVVVNSNSNVSMTDSLGRYLIVLKSKDSIWFSLFGKSSPKFPIDTITDPQNFNVMIHVMGYDLPEVKVRNSNYRFDSIQNRTDYAKYFNYRPPGIRLSNNQQLFGPAGMTIGFDLNELINMFRFQRNRNLQFLQNRLLAQEQEKYVNSRFTKRFVQKLTHLEGDGLIKFMNFSRPTYEMLGLLNELELGVYIEKRFDAYQKTN